jgi:hypothetical protein
VVEGRDRRIEMAAADRGAEVPSPYGDGMADSRACNPSTSTRS